jgi:integrase
VLTEHWARCRERATTAGVTLSQEAFVFSHLPDGRTHLVPSSVTQRYSRLVRRLGIDTHLHSLRHHSATELIAAVVDVRTVAGRLSHSGGGVSTLRVYAAWPAEADQRALLRSAVRRAAGRDADVADYELDVLASDSVLRTFVTTA